ncbi:MAG TPA: HdeD family acid-resistance protein [Bryobacteraceae bacterium]|nr:HdeD family acid-resistance protein [Bryobacteraceae bacterium]
MPREDSLLEIRTLFAGRWWAMVLRGIVAIVFGVLAFAWPGVTLATLVLLFGWYALIDGIFSLVSAFGGRRAREDRWLLALEGIVGLWAGFVTLRAPAITAIVLVFFISIWAMVTGFLRIAAAFRLRREISGEVWLALSGVLAVLFAVMLMFRPLAGAMGLVWVIAGFALVLGVTLIMLGFELRHLRAIPSH